LLLETALGICLSYHTVALLAQDVSRSGKDPYMHICMVAEHLRSSALEPISASYGGDHGGSADTDD
jgi:hypothetical protein